MALKTTFQVTDPVDYENQQNFHSISVLHFKGNESLRMSLTDL